MKTFGTWLTYTVLRLLFVAVPFAIMLVVLPNGLWFWTINAIVSVVIGLCLSYLLLNGLRERLAAALRHRRRVAKEVVSDVDAEDAVTETRAADYTPSVGTVLEDHDRARSHPEGETEH